MRPGRTAFLSALLVAPVAFLLQLGAEPAPTDARVELASGAAEAGPDASSPTLPVGAERPEADGADAPTEAEARAGEQDEEAGDDGSRDDGRRDEVRRDDDRDDDRGRRRRWRRSRNRYPGPIPTPAEWEPPEGPVRIGLQAGHWKAHEAPRELNGLRNGGTRWGNMAEWEVNLEIARTAGGMLEEMGYVVDILPAVVPPSYRAHLFISIHADGSGDSNARGYRIAAPRRDPTGRADRVVELLERSYGEATGLGRLPTVTRRMRNYYAFNFRRYEHALHPMTIGVIIETGFLTSPSDRRVIVDEPERAARGIVDAVTAFPVTRTPTPDVAVNPG